MAKQLNFEFKGVHYCLEYTRTTVRNMEQVGFNINEVTDKMMIRLPQLFEGAFMAHHGTIKPALVKEIYRAMPNKQDLFLRLREMYLDPYEELLSEPDGDAGNINWTANWESEEE